MVPCGLLARNGTTQPGVELATTLVSIRCRLQMLYPLAYAFNQSQSEMMTISFIGTLNIPGMNIFRHNALRICDVQE